MVSHLWVVIKRATFSGVERLTPNSTGLAVQMAQGQPVEDATQLLFGDGACHQVISKKGVLAPACKPRLRKAPMREGPRSSGKRV